VRNAEIVSIVTNATNSFAYLAEIWSGASVAASASAPHVSQSHLTVPSARVHSVVGVKKTHCARVMHVIV